MGTNYYLRIKCCPNCGKPDDGIHIGKSSAGWCFSLHVHPHDGINDLTDWERKFDQENTKIVNEYEEKVSKEEMIKIITNRHWKGREPSGSFYEENHALPGPNGLMRHRLGFGCIKHGEGTWDCIDNDFG